MVLWRLLQDGTCGELLLLTKDSSGSLRGTESSRRSKRAFGPPPGSVPACPLAIRNEVREGVPPPPSQGAAQQPSSVDTPSLCSLSDACRVQGPAELSQMRLLLSLLGALLWLHSPGFRGHRSRGRVCSLKPCPPGGAGTAVCPQGLLCDGACLPLLGCEHCSPTQANSINRRQPRLEHLQGQGAHHRWGQVSSMSKGGTEGTRKPADVTLPLPPTGQWCLKCPSSRSPCWEYLISFSFHCISEQLIYFLSRGSNETLYFFIYI